MTNFTRLLACVPALLLTAQLSQAQTVYPSISLIGPAVADWNTDVPMTHPTTTNLHQWTITTTFRVGEMKVRTTNDWAVNWGAAAFPAGTGTANGPNIQVTPAGVYKVTFDDITGTYQFTAAVLATTAATAVPGLGLALTPNPTHEATTVSYDLPAAAPVSLTVRNVLGRVVRQLPPVPQAAGHQTQVLGQLGLVPGVYLVQLQAGAQRQTTRLVVE